MKYASRNLTLHFLHAEKQCSKLSSCLGGKNLHRIHGGAYFSAVCWWKFIPIVLTKRMRTENAVGCLFFLSRSILFCLSQFAVRWAIRWFEYFAPKNIIILKPSQICRTAWKVLDIKFEEGIFFKLIWQDASLPVEELNIVRIAKAVQWNQRYFKNFALFFVVAIFEIFQEV